MNRKLLVAEASPEYHRQVKTFAKKHNLSLKRLILRGLQAEMGRLEREALLSQKPKRDT